MLSVANIYKTNKLGPTKSPWVYQVRLSGCANPWKLSLDHLHEEVRDDMLRWSKGFVVTGLGEAGADACTIMKITAHSSVTLSERYVHPTREGMEHAFERLQELNATRAEEAIVEEGQGRSRGSRRSFRGPHNFHHSKETTCSEVRASG